MVVPPNPLRQSKSREIFHEGAVDRMCAADGHAMLRAAKRAQIQFDSVADFPKLPDGMNFGEVPGVAVNSKGHVFVFTRSNSANGPAYAPAAAQLLEFAAEGDFCAKSARVFMPGRSPTAYASTRTTISGPSTRART